MTWLLILAWARDMVTWYSYVDTLIWQMSIDQPWISNIKYAHSKPWLHA